MVSPSQAYAGIFAFVWMAALLLGLYWWSWTLVVWLPAYGYSLSPNFPSVHPELKQNPHRRPKSDQLRPYLSNPSHI